MRRAVAIAGLLLSVALAMSAQDERPQPVQITKGPRVEAVTGETAVIAWSTNVNASTLVRYGTEQQQLTATAEEPWGGLTHRVTIRNLKPGTTYYFQAESNHGQGTGTKAVSDIATFSTRGQASALPQGGGPEATDSVQVLVGPVPQNVTEHSAQIWWESSRPSDTIVKYGTSPDALSEIKQKPWGDQSHRVELTGLQPATQYYVAVVNPEGGVRGRARFKTADANQAGLRIVDGPRVEFVGNNSAVVAWTTDAPSSGLLRYGTSAQNLSDATDAPGGARTTHRVTLHHLQPNQLYYFSVESAAAKEGSTLVSSGIAPFRTAANAEQALHIGQR